MRLRAIRTIASVAAMGLTFALLSSPTADAYDASVAVSVVASKCSTKQSWTGEVRPNSAGLWAGYKVTQPKGSYKFCAYKLKLKDKDKKGDYYAYNATLRATQNPYSQNDLEYFADSKLSMTIISGTNAIDHVYDATPTITKRTAGPVSVSVGVGPISISMDSVFERSGKLTKNTETKKSASWSTNRVGDFEEIEVVYAQKVKNGVSPKVTFHLVSPDVAYKWTSFRTTAHGYPYTAWKPSSKTRSTRYTVFTLK